MARKKTILLGLILLVSVLTMSITYFRMSKFRDDAQIARSNLVKGQQTLGEIHQWKSSPGRAAAVSADQPQIERHIRDAAAATRIGEIRTITPGDIKSIDNSEYSETPIFLGLNPLPLRQVTLFLHKLAEIAPSARTITIELATPTPSANPSASEQIWGADITVGFLSYTPRKKGK